MARMRALIAASPSATRADLARQVCEAFDWRTHKGDLKAMCCREAMIRMSEDGLISLPAPRASYRRIKSTFASSASDPEPLREFPLGELKDLHLEVVGRGDPLRLWNEYVARYHYLGYGITLGAQIRYFVRTNDRVLGLMSFGGAAWKVEARDRFIGWDRSAREQRLHLIVDQTRYLILPWVRCQNLATKALALARHRLASDWLDRYGYSPALLETFVEERFHGTCYKADNWICVGLTKGRGRMDRTSQYDKPIKSIWLKPLNQNFRALLQGTSEGPKQ